MSSSTTSTTSVSIPSTAAAGGLTITKPPQTATSYYKISSGNIITFAWNYTSLYVTPTSLTLSAVCDNGNTYPVGPTDGIIPGTDTSVTWDIWSYNEANPGTPLAVASYTLEIWGDGGQDATASAGEFSSNSDLEFALYSPQAYTPLSDWTCSGCDVSGAWSNYVTHPAFVSLVATLAVMFLSGFAVLRQARQQ